METFHLFTIFNALVFLQLFLKSYSNLIDTITPTQSITDGVTLVSSGQTFELGFFSPGSSKNRYIGIWYKATPEVVVWVANRNNPISHSYGELIITNQGNLLLLANQTRSIIIWSTNTSMVAKNPVAQILESGNLVVGDRDSLNSEVYVWQSFDYPTDNFLAGMKIGWNLKTGFERHLTSWKSNDDDDPSTGDFTWRLTLKGLPQLFIIMGTTRIIKFRSGPWNGVRFNGSPSTLAFPVFKFFLVSNEDEVYYSFRSNAESVITRVQVNSHGSMARLTLYNGSTQWSIMYEVPYEPCDGYGYCGANGICRINTDPFCECLKGFSPRSVEEWKMLNWSSGCVRKVPLDCQGRGDGFLKLEGVKFPDFLEFLSNKSMSLEECKEVCLKNCSCTAYANSDLEKGSGCMIWFGDLVDVRELRNKVSEENIYLRLPASEIRTRIDKEDELELPLFDLATIASATNNFSPEYLIGAGGFGDVYKGNLKTGQEIAVKRLSKNSGQGAEEFRNEVELLAKLQHRNLVALFGCCIQEEERMLIYEYMPNASLDHFIFDNARRKILGWEKEFDIIMGIARGLLYLHRDSKLQIIHRDLKASNILLDGNLNPKISDFGLARIFEGDEKETRTKRVVGTYGYMSPEYAIDGKFSVKSDVFSFGVLLLEILSGKRNRRFNHPDHHHNLVGHAWLLWNEGKALDLVDLHFEDTCNVDSAQVLKCVQVGLLCVQKFPCDRPTMSSIVYMLEDDATLPPPKQPGFFMERSSKENEDTISRNEEPCSLNSVTLTMANGR
ncbi:G-type lectin S-receptor-like serine/threonine-protein kinase At4g27290 isoform X2 [Ziziphus jujuba]|uniref:Receptor-like serine/threonine-protein kinase n=1 Tax=Ziziphus jujuba TaxID=326968 RepID=A0ABM4AH90_ZIZJJ|nr:G-type lectin S-receptor-like serine/threonine-protein kinase At4g27290 isoform X2 [Ziziphus jujuba]